MRIYTSQYDRKPSEPPSMGNLTFDEKEREGPEDTNPIWDAAIQKYYEELRESGLKGSAIDKDLWNIESPDELLAEIEMLAPPESKNTKSWGKYTTQLKPTLLGLGDFMAWVALLMGMNSRVAAIIWGSIRLIAQLAQPLLPQFVDMLDELQKALPRFHQYEKELPMTKTMETALFEMYKEIIVFCAHAITFFHNNPNAYRSRNIWSQFNKDFKNVVMNLRALSRRVDEAADIIRMSKETHTSETVAVARGVRKSRISDVELPCHMIPYGLNLRFFGREPEARLLRSHLDPTEDNNQMRVVAIHGLGGVGKTQLALHYANTSMKLYEAIAWIPAETQIKLVQALSNFASKLGLQSQKGNEDDYQSVQKVRDWLNSTDKNFILVFDNVADAELLELIWPATTRASIIITTRSPSVAAAKGTTLLDLKKFNLDTGDKVLHSLTGIEPGTDEEREASLEVSGQIDGLALTLMQVSSFIRNRRYTYKEFAALYKKATEKILTRSEIPIEYSYTSLTTWDMSLERLSAEAKSLLNLLAFFDPDLIPERLITNTKAKLDEPSLEFLFDEFDFGEAVTELVKASLVDRLASSQALSMHRIVQFATLSKLTPQEKTFYFANLVKILSDDYPNTWNQRGNFQGHGYQAWETCSATLPHVSSMMTTTEKFKFEIPDPELWAELIFRTGIYLWEKEMPVLGLSYLQFGLQQKIDPNGASAAQAHRSLGHVFLDLARPRAALDTYCKALAIREKIEEADSPPIADVYDSIACSYCEIGDIMSAYNWLDKALAIHRAHDPSKRARTEAIYALTHLRAREADKALEKLQTCWSLSGFSQDEILKSSYPKHSGDIVLISRILRAQGHTAEAQELASRSVLMRRGTFGEKGGPRVADSTFLVSQMLSEKGEYVLAAKLLREVLEMCGGMEEMLPHLARALWFLAGIEKMQGHDESWEELRVRAWEEREKIAHREWADEDTDESFMRLVGWMLW